MDHIGEIKTLLEMSPQRLEQEIPGAFHFSLWLIPNQNDEDYFAKIIHRLSKRYKSPVFKPHVTVFTGIGTREDDIENIITECIAGRPVISLNARGVSCTNTFFKSLFVSFDNSPILMGIYKNIIKKVKCPICHTLEPHLSLIYKELPAAIKQNIVKNLHIENAHVSFDSIQVVTPQNITKGWGDIGKWKTVIRRNIDAPVAR